MVAARPALTGARWSARRSCAACVAAMLKRATLPPVLVVLFSSGVIANITPLTARPSVIPYADARKPSFKVALTPAEQAAAGRPPLAGAVATTRTVQVTQQQQQKAGRRRKRWARVQLMGIPVHATD